MKPIMVAALLSMMVLGACHTPKDEKKLPITADQAPQTQTPIAEPIDPCAKAKTDNPGQNQVAQDDAAQNSPHQSENAPTQNCETKQEIAENTPSPLPEAANPPPSPVHEIEVGALLFSDLKSWRNPVHDKQGLLVGSEGACVDGLTSVFSAENLMSDLNLSYGHLPLSAEANSFGISVSCLATVKVSYTPGYSFAIRKVGLGAESKISENSLATFNGTYRADGQKPVRVEALFDAKYDGKKIQIDHLVEDSGLAFSDCSGQDTLSFETHLAMNFIEAFAATMDPNRAEDDKRNGRIHHGEMNLTQGSPARFELVWKKCD